MLAGPDPHRAPIFTSSPGRCAGSAIFRPPLEVPTNTARSISSAVSTDTRSATSTARAVVGRLAVVVRTAAAAGIERDRAPRLGRIVGQPSSKVAELLHGAEVDIAIDLMGHTQHSRLGIVAHRPAPVQTSYLGFPGTTGAEFIDYILADRFVLPLDQQAFFTEKIVHLPESYQPTDPIARFPPSEANSDCVNKRSYSAASITTTRSFRRYSRYGCVC